MEQETKNTWKNNLHIPTREEQHRLYSGEIEEQDFNMQQGYNLYEWALKTDKDMCAAIPELGERWCGLELDWLMYQYGKDEEDNYE